MSSSNRERLAYKAEVTFGTNLGGDATALNFTSNSLTKSNETQNSNFVRSDTNIAGTVRTGINVGGDVGIELQYGEYDPFIEAVLRSTFPTALSISANTTIAFVNSSNSITGTGLFGNAVVGQWVKVSGATNAANNGYFLITSKPDSDSIVVAGATLTDETAGQAITIKGAACQNSTTEKSFTLERQFLDITEYQLYTGMRVGSLALNFNTAAIASGSLSFLGQEAANSGSSGFNANPTAASTTASMNTVDNIKQIFINRVASTYDFLSLDFTISTNSEGLRKIGALPVSAVSQRSIGVSGNFGLYKEDDVFDDYKNDFSSLDIAIVTEDAAGNGYVWHFPECYIGDGSNNNQGVNTDIIENYSFMAVLDPTLGTTMSVSRFPA